jgi:hypothetical protein
MMPQRLRGLPLPPLHSLSRHPSTPPRPSRPRLTPPPFSKVPRLVFVNKLDRVGASPFRVIQQARDKLKLNAAAVQVRAAAAAGGAGRGPLCCRHAGSGRRHAASPAAALLGALPCCPLTPHPSTPPHPHPPPQMPIGLEEFHEGVVDLVGRRAYRFKGKGGLEVRGGRRARGAGGAHRSGRPVWRGAAA